MNQQLLEIWKANTLPVPSAKLLIKKPTIKFQTVPYEHQRKVVVETLSRPNFALFAEQGTGKTKMTLDTWANLPEITGLLILAPNGVHSNWVINEIPKHLPRENTILAVWDGSDTLKWKKTFKQAIKSIKKGLKTTMAMNIEAIRTKRGFDHATEFLRAGPCMMVIDESTVIKNPKALQTKQAMKLRPLAKYRRILTGTPITQGPLDLYSQIAFLDPNIWPHGSWTAFKSEFAIEQLCSAGTRKYTKIIGYRNTEKMTEILKDHVVQIKKRDCLDLPEKIYSTRNVEMTSEQWHHYLEIKNMALTMMDSGGMVTATNALTLLLRLQQIVCGHIKDDAGNITELPTNRIMKMLEVIEEVPQSKVIIWAHFKPDIRRINQTLADNYGHRSVVHYFGETSNDKREEAVQRFQDDPECRFFVANEAASRGLTLTASDTVVYYSNNTKLEYRLQSEDRNHRIGQVNNVVYHDLVANGTTDEKILQALRSKKDLASMVMGGMVSLKDLM